MHHVLHPESNDSNSLSFSVQLVLAAICPVIEHLLFFHSNSLLISFGLIMMIVGVAIRWGAILTANTNFHLFVQTSRTADHVLVKTGVYRYIRHPAYFGFYVFAIGTQLFLTNVASLIVYIIFLFNFFSKRIRYEEKWLIRMFGDEYVEYRKATPTWIPFIP
jgi:protein-S-isoprenylcysteine O-methyltransferase